MVRRAAAVCRSKLWVVAKVTLALDKPKLLKHGDYAVFCSLIVIFCKRKKPT